MSDRHRRLQGAVVAEQQLQTTASAQNIYSQQQCKATTTMQGDNNMRCNNKMQGYIKFMHWTHVCQTCDATSSVIMWATRSTVQA
jgi:hypothetical protein